MNLQDEWLYNALDRMGEVYDIPGKEDEAKALNEKVERIKKVVKAKADIIVDMWKKNKNMEEKVTSLEASEAKLVEKVDALEASGSNCRECILTKQVIRNKDALITKKEKETKAEEKKKVDIKRQFDNQSKVVKDMKINYEKAVEENNELRNKFDEQTDIIKHLQEQCGIDDDEDDVEEVPVQRNLMDKNKSGHLCLTCNFRFTSNNGLEQHIQEKHTELSCNYCEKSFRTKREANNHMDHCEQLGTEAIECNNCNKKFVRWGSKKHKCQPPQKQIACKTCDRMFKTISELKKHITDEHTGMKDKSKLVCRYYRDGKCLKGDHCEYSHVGFVRNNVQLNSNSRTTQKASTCRHGDNCLWLARGECSFYHQGVGVQKPRQQGVQGNQKQAPRKENRQNGQTNPLICPRGATCAHLARGLCNYGGVFYHIQQETKLKSRKRTRSRYQGAEGVRRPACVGRTITARELPATLSTNHCKIFPTCLVQ